MKKIKIYEFEKFDYLLAILPTSGLLFAILIIYLKINNPEGWAPYGFLVAIIFILLWTLLVTLIIYKLFVKAKLNFIRVKEDLISNGSKIDGEIIASSKRPKSYVNGMPKSWRYYAEIKIIKDDKEETFETPALLINPKLLISNKVTVYYDEENYYATDFQISESVANEKLTNEEEKDIQKALEQNAYLNVSMLISGITMFIGIIYIISKTDDIFTKIITLPFLICSLGSIIQGTFSLLYKGESKYKNLGKNIVFLGFFLFWFGFLSILDYIAIRDSNYSILLFSTIFWIGGIVALIKTIKK